MIQLNFNHYIKKLIIPDTQVKAGVALNHLEWIGKYLVEKRPDVVVHLGDFADMHSLSTYDNGTKKDFHSRRYFEDIAVAKEGMAKLVKPLRDLNRVLAEQKKKQYNPRMFLLLGNHEHRITRAVNADPVQLDGLVSINDLEYSKFGWEVVPFLDTIDIQGVTYAHYFPRGPNGRVMQDKRGAPNAKAQVQREMRSCTAGHLQGLDYYIYQTHDRRFHGLVAGSCLTPEHKILTSDLRYIALKDIKVGDTIVSFDETPSIEKRARRYKKGTILATKIEPDDVYRVTLKSGKVFNVTYNHQWLVRQGTSYIWRTTESLRKGTRIPKILDEFEFNDSYKSGWLAGMYDGEGSIYLRPTTGGNSTQLALSQREGPTLQQCRDILTELGYPTTTDSRCGSAQTLRIMGGQREISKLLGTIRPQRLLSKFTPDALGRINCPDNRDDIVETIIYIGKQDIVRISIDTKTMVVEGYGHHNCYLQEEDYLTPQGTKYWRGVVVKHEVMNGEYDIMTVSLDYLCRKYEGQTLDEFMKSEYNS